MKLVDVLKGLGYNPNRGAGGRFASGPSLLRRADKMQKRIKATKMPGSSRAVMLNQLDSVERNVEASRGVTGTPSSLGQAKQMLDHVEEELTRAELPKGRWDILTDLRAVARGGERIMLNGKTLHGGMGNPSGLHGYYHELAAEGAAKSHARLTRAVREAKKGDVFDVMSFRNITRDRGVWARAYSHKVK